MLAYQRRSFKTELLAAIRLATTDRIKRLKCRPEWLNGNDFHRLSEDVGLEVLSQELEEISGMIGLLHYLGAEDASLKDLIPGLGKAFISIQGCAEIVAQLTRLYNTKQITSRDIRPDWKIWPLPDGITTLENVIGSKQSLETKFLDLVVEKVNGKHEFKHLLEGITDQATASALFPLKEKADSPEKDNRDSIDTLSSARTASTSTPSRRQIALKRWRRAEEQVMTVLRDRGWEVSDVSRQKVGYDLEVKVPEGQLVYIEVKSIDYPGKEFTLTINERSAAEEKGTNYVIALVHSTEESIEITFIRDPVNNVKMERQVKEWVWECSEYNFLPEIFPAI